MTTLFKISYILLVLQLGILIVYGVFTALIITLYVTIATMLLSGILIFLNEYK